MRTSIRRCVIALALPAVLVCCQLFGGSTQVRFDNATGSVTLASIQLGSLTDASPLAPGAVTGYFSVVPGQNVLTAKSDAGALPNSVLFTIVAGHSYTVTFSGTSFLDMTVTLSPDN